MKCDFCSSESNLNWRYPCKSGEFIEGGYSLGDWLACDYCHSLIRAGDWHQLAENSTRVYPFVISGFMSFNEALDGILKLHQRFRQSRLGPPVKVT